MRYQAIYKSSIADGLGWRVVLFVSGCEHRCKGCHNENSWNKDLGKEFTDDDLRIILDELKKPEIDGLTLSGGDPLAEYNRDYINAICKYIKLFFPNKNIWLYTGYLWEEIKDLELLKNIDVLIDGPFIQELRDITLAFRGSSNQRIIDVKESLKQNKVIEKEID